MLFSIVAYSSSCIVVIFFSEHHFFYFYLHNYHYRDYILVNNYIYEY